MTESIIKCPQCGTNIPLTETLSNQLREKYAKELDEKLRLKERGFADREQTLTAEREKLQSLQDNIAKQIAEGVRAESDNIKKQARLDAEKAIDVELKDMKEQVAEKDRKIADAQKQEIEFRKKVRDLEEQKKTIELEVLRRVDTESEKIRRQTFEMSDEQHRLKDLEKDKQIQDMQKLIEELKRKSQQGSMQTQGEVLELDLEQVLRATYPLDSISPVSKGVRGADILQKVLTASGTSAGTIIWETKRTKAWSDGWVRKVKDDQREAKAELAVIVSEALPEEIQSFAQIDGVWVVSPAMALNLANVLRILLLHVCQVRLASVSVDKKMEALHTYLTGTEFRQRVEAIVEAFVSMKGDLEREKRATIKTWAKREKELDRVIVNTSGMYGDLQGIIGSSLTTIKQLEAGDDGDVESELEF